MRCRCFFPSNGFVSMSAPLTIMKSGTHTIVSVDTIRVYHVCGSVEPPSIWIVMTSSIATVLMKSKPIILRLPIVVGAMLLPMAFSFRSSGRSFRVKYYI